jgi:hypothetical protein
MKLTQRFLIAGKEQIMIDSDLLNDQQDLVADNDSMEQNLIWAISLSHSSEDDSDEADALRRKSEMILEKI